MSDDYDLIAEDAIVDDFSNEAFLEDPSLVEDLLQQIAASQDAALPAVDRYWLSEHGFLNMALVHQNANAALVVNDGENTIALFDSHQSDVDYLYQIAAIVQRAIMIIEDEEIEPPEDEGDPSAEA
jgi:hypothetical protein